MKKQKIKKKPHKIETEQREAKARFIAESDTEMLELTPQAPLGADRQAEFQADAHKH